MIASCSSDGTIKIFDVIFHEIGDKVRFLGNERYTFRGHQGPVRAITMASDQSFLVSAGNDGTIRIWRAASDAALLKVEAK